MNDRAQRGGAVLLGTDFERMSRIVERIYWSEPDPAVRSEYLRSLAELFQEREKKQHPTHTYKSIFRTIQTAFQRNSVGEFPTNESK